MSDRSAGPGWWQASDGRWYPPELHPSAQSPESPATDPQAAWPGHVPGPALSGGLTTAVMITLYGSAALSLGALVAVLVERVRFDRLTGSGGGTTRWPA